MTEAQARALLARDGPNALPEAGRRGLAQTLRAVLLEPMFLLLMGCGGIYLLLGDVHEALMLLGFVGVVVAITLVQQRRSERSLQALRGLSAPQALVLRDGQARRVPGAALVQGDVALLAEGDRIPADMLLLQAANLSVDESMLTGESVPAAKQALPEATASTRPGAAEGNASGTSHGIAPADAAPEACRVYAGTLVTQGTARAQVCATGPRSALGRLGQSLAQLDAGETDIQRETRTVVRRVALVGLGLATVLALAHGLRSGDALQGLLAGLTLAMAILPEELPVVLTLFLGLGAWRLAREQVLARSLPAIEQLGATTVLCVDKTGTLTANRMALRRLWTPLAEQDIPAGLLAAAPTTSATTSTTASTAPGPPPAAARPEPLPEALHEVLEFAVLASHRRAFDPMETAITQAGAALLARTEHLHGDWTLVDDYPLSPRMLAMSRVWRSPDRRALVIAAKGAPEAVVDLCHMDAHARAAVAAQVATLAAGGLRVLGVARAAFAAPALPGDQHDFDFEFLGLVALEDPLRPDVNAAIAECRAAGMRVVMLTGDHPATALSIARQAGLQDTNHALSGDELAALDDAALARRLEDTTVFCRVRPEHKLRLVRAYQAQGHTVAMTGDGVNDAPALKAANIGVAMGARGTDVAREAAALVLLNDDFASLVTAVRHGRRIFANLRKAIAFVVAVHVPIIGLSLLPVALGWPLLLLPVHILFLQLVIDPACSVVFEAEALEADAMRRPPRPRGQHLFGAEVMLRGLLQGSGLLGILLAVFALAHQASGSDDTARALTFAVMVLANLGLIHANRRWHAGAWRSPGGVNRAFAWVGGGAVALLALVLGVPAIRTLFAFALPDPKLLAAGGGAVLLALVWFEGVKWGLGVWGRRSL